MNKKYIQIAFFVSIGGVLFAGYYSMVRFFSATCPFNESCPIIWGQPACYFGFLLFVLSMTSAALTLFLNIKIFPALVVDVFLGILFTAYLSYLDLFYPSCPTGVCQYDLLLPTCMYGFLFFLIIFILIVLAYVYRNEKNN